MAPHPAEHVGSGALEEDKPSLRVRAFFGLPVPEPQREQLAPFIAECAQAAPEFRWTPRENLHLTIRFIGSVDRPTVEEIAGALAARPIPAFTLDLGEIGTFARGRRVKVVWLGLRAGADGTIALAAQVGEECSRAGLVGEVRPFQPHLTLARARLREGAHLPALPPAPQLNQWRADELVLYSSRLARTGATYEVIGIIPLTG
jgi:2'-5' RNA ligase